MNDLKTLFYDPRQGLISVDKLYKKTKELNLNLSYNQVKSFYEKQPVNQLLKPIRKPQHFNSIKADYPSHIYQVDIMVYTRFTYHSYKYILVVIDIYSRFMECRAMTNRSMINIIKNFKSIIDNMGAPYLIQGDQEFNKKQFVSLLINNNIKFSFSSPYQVHKNAIVERVNLTISMLLQKQRIVTKRYDWYNWLNDMSYNYNHTKHNTIKNTPFDVFTGKAFNLQVIKKVEVKLRIGDKVRKIEKLHIFQKGDSVKASKDIYIISDIQNNKIYLQGDNYNSYKPYELFKVTQPDNDDIIDYSELPTNEIKNNKIKQLFKKLDISQDNILDYKRKH
jgi:hypothetical protein